MNRMEEYDALLRELEETPARLNSAVTRAKARTRRQRLRRWIGGPLTGLAAVCACFVLLVNLSAPFARALAGIPFLGELAQAVSFSTSLTAAVENEYVQTVGQTQSANGAELTIEYLIMDQKQLNIFYTTGGDAAAVYDVDFEVQAVCGTEVHSLSAMDSRIQANGELRKLTVDFDFPLMEASMIDVLRLACHMRPLEEAAIDTQGYTPSEYQNQTYWNWRRHVPAATVPEPIATLSFDLTFDPDQIKEGRVVEVGRWLDLDGQRLLVKNVEIYPTHLQVNLEGDPANTAWPEVLDFYAEDENGMRYKVPLGLISGTRFADSGYSGFFRLESNYFSEGEHLTLYLNGVRWESKDQEWAWVDQSTGESGGFPEWIELLQCSRTRNDVHLTFRAYVAEGYAFISPGFGSWRLPGGSATAFNSFNIGQAVRNGDHYDVTVTLRNFPGNRVELLPFYSWASVFEDPIEIPIL